jgi:hypothetical protein
MVEIFYKLFFNNKAASRAQLDRVEEISVEQEEEKAWQASLVIPICVNEKGEWSGEDEDFLSSFTRVRVEIQLNEKDFIPLIDGPIVGFNTDMDSAPGRSQLTAIVHDDSAFLNHTYNLETFEGKTDHDIAEYLFKQATEIATSKIADTPASQNDTSDIAVRNGTAMQILKMIAGRQGMQAYVLPGKKAGQSIGMFQPHATEVGELTPLVLLGKKRNVLNFSVQNNAQNPVKVQASRLNFKDKTVSSQTSNFSDLNLLGEEKPLKDESQAGLEELSPYRYQAVDLGQAVTALAARSCYALGGQGGVLGGCYPDVLQPYKVVYIEGANGRLSGAYNITKVTHRLTRSAYTQDFSVKRNALSQGKGSAGPSSGSLNPAINGTKVT